MSLTRGAFVLALVLAACGPSTHFTVDGGPGGDGSGGTCSTPGATRCSGYTYQTCSGGNWVDTTTCTAPQVCAQDLGCVACNPQVNQFCSGDTVYQCNPDGTVGPMVQTCAFEACVNGMCQDPCGAAAQNRSYIGCEYWPVDLDNAVEVLGADQFGLGCDFIAPGSMAQSIPVCWDGSNSEGQCDYGSDCSQSPGTSCSTQSVCVLDAQHSPFAVVVSNPDPTTPAMVTIQNAAGMSQSVSVAPGAVQSIFPQMLGFPDQSLDNSGLTNKAYKLTSDRPIVAYQFNPLDNVGVFSNDASLLIPVTAYDVSYYVLTYKTLTRRPTSNDYSGYVTIVASGPGMTTVTVTPTANVRAGQNVPALPAGSPHMFTMNQFDVLNLEAVADGELSGSTITSSQPVGVFVGHEATVLSNTTQGPCCADHLEDQLFPSSTWGKAYAVARSQSRGQGEPDMLRIMAQKPGTTVSFNPAPMQGSCGTLGPGQFCDVFIGGDTEVTGSEPILVGHYLLSVGFAAGVNPPGDPEIDFAVPTEQYRTSYAFLVPSQYANNYVSLVAPAAGTVALDGNDVTAQLATFGSGMFHGGRTAVNAGPHKLDCPMGCGVEVYGYDAAVAYLFAGGLDLKQIVVGKELPQLPPASR